jgi:hypothetical protein
MTLFVKLFIFFGFASISNLVVALPSESKKLGYCEFVYFYGAQLVQIDNNEGAAKNFLRRSAMMSVANFMLIEENGVINGAKIKEYRGEALMRKSDFDKNRNLVFKEISKCDIDFVPLALKIRSQNKILWSKSFDELQLEFFNKSMENLGIK